VIERYEERIIDFVFCSRLKFLLFIIQCREVTWRASLWVLLGRFAVVTRGQVTTFRFAIFASTRPVCRAFYPVSDSCYTQTFLFLSRDALIYSRFWERLCFGLRLESTWHARLLGRTWISVAWNWNSDRVIYGVLKGPHSFLHILQKIKNMLSLQVQLTSQI
jgi:hypothetical protein